MCVAVVLSSAQAGIGMTCAGTVVGMFDGVVRHYIHVCVWYVCLRGGGEKLCLCVVCVCGVYVCVLYTFR